MPTKPGWTSAYMLKETKQRYRQLGIMDEQIEDTFERIVRTAELLKQAFPSEQDVWETAKLLVESGKFRDTVINLLRPLQKPNETIVDTLNRLLSSKDRTPQNIKSATSTRAVI